jgi:hypothetical protein
MASVSRFGYGVVGRLKDPKGFQIIPGHSKTAVLLGAAISRRDAGEWLD